MLASRKFSDATLSPQEHQPSDSPSPIRRLVNRLPRPTWVNTVLLSAALVFGVLTVLLGEVVTQRPIFALALPVLLAIVFTFVVSPKALVLAIIFLRGGMNQVFENTRVVGLGGLGAAVNLAVIVLAFTLVMKDPKRIPRQAWWAWIPFLAIQTMGAIYSPDPITGIRFVLAQVSTASLFFIAFHFIDDLPSFDTAMKWVLASSVPVVVIALIAVARGETVSAAVDESAQNRFAAPFPHPNILAFYTVLTISIVLYLWKQKRLQKKDSILQNVFCIAYLLILFVVLFATKTRSAWIAAAFIFLLYGIFIERRYLIYLTIAPFLAMLVPEIRDRIIDLGSGNEVVTWGKLNSFAWRQYIWRSGLEWMKPSHYLFGYGTDAFINTSRIFFPLAGTGSYGAHSVFVQLLFDSGIVGFGAYLWLFFKTFQLAWPARRIQSLLAIIFLGLLVSYLIVSSSDNMLDYLVFNWYFWFAMGATCAVAVARQKTKQADTSSYPMPWRTAARSAP